MDRLVLADEDPIGGDCNLAAVEINNPFALVIGARFRGTSTMDARSYGRSDRAMPIPS